MNWQRVVKYFGQQVSQSQFLLNHIILLVFSPQNALNIYVDHNNYLNDTVSLQFGHLHIWGLTATSVTNVAITYDGRTENVILQYSPETRVCNVIIDKTFFILFFYNKFYLGRKDFHRTFT